MTDMLNDQSRPYLSSAELRAIELPESRKGGVDRAICEEIIERAAVTIDALSASIDRLQEEREYHIAQMDTITAESNSQATIATRLLAAASDTADRVVADATEEAASIIADADEAAAALSAETAARRSSMYDDIAATKKEIDDELAAVRAAAGAERSAIDSQLDTWRTVMQEKRQQIIAATSDIARALDAATDAVTPLPASVDPTDAPTDIRHAQDADSEAGAYTDNEAVQDVLSQEKTWSVPTELPVAPTDLPAPAAVPGLLWGSTPAAQAPDADVQIVVDPALPDTEHPGYETGFGL